MASTSLPPSPMVPANERVVAVALSGGTDSAAALLRLCDEGVRTFGMTLRMHDAFDEVHIEDARALCETAGVPFHVFDVRDAFRTYVIDAFIASYERGETPNPCVICNNRVKFGCFYEKAREAGATHMATGHYAKVVYNDGRYRLLAGNDPAKDQSYFLAMLTQEQLARTLFPLGESTKTDVKKYVRSKGVTLHQKKESQDACFIAGETYISFIERVTGKRYVPGNVLDTKGNVVGKHEGIIRYTTGQRKGLGIAMGYPVYVTDVDAEANTVIIGAKEETRSRVFTLRDVNLIADVTFPLECEVKARYRSRRHRCRVTHEGETLVVRYTDAPQTVTRGQLAVLYKEEETLGGGWIATREARAIE